MDRGTKTEKIKFVYKGTSSKREKAVKSLGHPCLELTCHIESERTYLTSPSKWIMEQVPQS